MKKIVIGAITLSMLITQTGCFGSFELVKKIYAFNDGVSDSKVVKTLMFYLLNIVPVYGVAGFLDVVIFNLIEFWSGSNPIAMKAGEMEEQYATIDGKEYKIIASRNKLSFTQLEGENAKLIGELVYSEADKSWSYVKEGKSQTLLTFLHNNQVEYKTSFGVQVADLNQWDNNTFAPLAMK
jgi:hypothetical protein